jgi:hypothetical protein
MSVLAKVTWVEDRRFVGRASSGHAIVVDASSEKQGPSPMELLLIGMAGCTAYDVVSILEKKRQAVTDLGSAPGPSGLKSRPRCTRRSRWSTCCGVVTSSPRL